MEHRQFDLAFERAHGLQKRRDRLRHAGHVVFGQREIGVHAPEDGVEKIDLPLALKDLSQAYALIEVDAVPGSLVDDEADTHQPVVADRLADRLVHHQSEARAVLGGPPEGVGPPIGAGGEELADQVAAGDRFDTVQPAIPATLRRGGVLLDDARNVVRVHFAREVAMSGFSDR